MQSHIGSLVFTKVSVISKLPYGHTGSFAATAYVNQCAFLLHSYHACSPLPATRSIPHRPVPASAQAVQRQRAVGYLRESLLLSYTALFDNVVFSVFEWLRLDKILKWLTPKLEDGYASLTGKWYTLADGQHRSISLVNHTAFDFSIPQQYKTADFPFDSSPETASQVAKTSQHGCTFDLPSLYRAHMLSLCMKLVYEKHEVIADIASRYLGCTLQGYFLTSDKQTKKQRHDAEATKHSKNTSKAAFVPRTLAILLEMPKAIIMAFRGTEPTNLINMRSSGKISMTHPEGMGGVHDGFWTALMYESEEEGGASLFDRLVEALQEGDQKLEIYLTGHSLGGALAAVFAQALVARGHEKLAQRVKGVHTFGGPRIGDADFCTLLGEQYPNRTFRYVHGADIIPKIPPRFLLYDHFPREIYLSSFGQLVLETRDIAKWHKGEAWGYLPIQLYKTVGNLIRLRESPIRTIYRLALLLTVPGLSDHFPQDYEQLLRDQVTSSADSHAPLIWSRHMLDDKFSRVQQIVTRV
ncbi:hypothetical protein WJX79_006617 [Trebouxia sp. C0005]